LPVQDDDYEGAILTFHVYDSGGAANAGTGVSIYGYHDSSADASAITSYGAPIISFELEADNGDGGVTKVVTVTDIPAVLVGVAELNTADTYKIRCYATPWYWKYTDVMILGWDETIEA
jgi:hypothetical protein